jgi:GntR family transcriptional regulator
VTADPPGPPPSLRVDLTSPVPPYEQLRAQLAGLITAGELPPGTRLPPVRQIAADLGLAGGTIARAYRELRAAGLVEGQGRHGTVVSESTGAGRQQALSAAADHLVATAHDLGLGEDAALAAVRAALDRHHAREAPTTSG